MNNYMEEAIKEAQNGMDKKHGGPFGAIIVKDNKVISRAHNTVLSSNDPTAHAEINAIRYACQKLNTYDLSNCIIYTTSEPCPMCLSAIMWANIKTIYFGADRKDTSKIGFKDEFIYNYLSGKEKQILNIKQLDRKKCIEILNKYQDIIY